MAEVEQAQACPCGSHKEYEACCGRFHAGQSWPETGEEMARSRYSAFVKGCWSYILASQLWDEEEISEQELAKRCAQVHWHSLDILDKGSVSKPVMSKTRPVDAECNPQTYVDIAVNFSLDGENGLRRMTERAIFEKQQGKLYYVAGQAFAPQRRTTPKVGRNEPCPCGSGKKYKKCCGKAQ